MKSLALGRDLELLLDGKLSKLSVKDESAFSNFGVFDVFDRTLVLIKSFVLVVGVGVDLEDFLCMGEGVYAAFKALSVPILMPNLEVANLWAAGLMDDALDGGVSGAGCGGSTATGAAGADATTGRQNGRAGLTQG